MGFKSSNFVKIEPSIFLLPESQVRATSAAVSEIVVAAAGDMFREVNIHYDWTYRPGDYLSPELLGQIPNQLETR